MAIMISMIPYPGNQRLRERAGGAGGRNQGWAFGMAPGAQRAMLAGRWANHVGAGPIAGVCRGEGPALPQDATVRIRTAGMQATICLPLPMAGASRLAPVIETDRQACRAAESGAIHQAALTTFCRPLKGCALAPS